MMIAVRSRLSQHKKAISIISLGLLISFINIKDGVIGKVNLYSKEKLKLFTKSILSLLLSDALINKYFKVLVSDTSSVLTREISINADVLEAIRKGILSVSAAALLKKLLSKALSCNGAKGDDKNDEEEDQNADNQANQGGNTDLTNLMPLALALSFFVKDSHASEGQPEQGKDVNMTNALIVTEKAGEVGERRAGVPITGPDGKRRRLESPSSARKETSPMTPPAMANPMRSGDREGPGRNGLDLGEGVEDEMIYHAAELQKIQTRMNEIGMQAVNLRMAHDACLREINEKTSHLLDEDDRLKERESQGREAIKKSEGLIRSLHEEFRALLLERNMNPVFRRGLPPVTYSFLTPHSTPNRSDTYKGD